RADGAADRALDKGAACRFDLRRKRLDDLGPHRAHLDEELALHRRQHLRIDRVHRRGVGEDADDDVGARREISRRRRHFQAGGLCLVGAPVPDHHLVPEACQPRRDAGAHLSDACDSDLHTVITSLVSIPTDTVALEGAWYEPAGVERTGAALLFHGNTMNFYSGAPRFL